MTTNEKKDALRATIIVRDNLSKQEFASAEHQLRDCKIYAAKKGWTLASPYDLAHDQRLTTGNSCFDRLIQDARSKKFNVLLAKSVEHISTDLEEAKVLFQHLDSYGIRISTVSDGELASIDEFIAARKKNAPEVASGEESLAGANDERRLSAPQQKAGGPTEGNLNSKRKKTNIAKIGSIAFWITILFLAASALALFFLASKANAEENCRWWQKCEKIESEREPKVECGATLVEGLMCGAAEDALAKTESLVGPQVELLFSPVEQRIPAYADFHYSVAGEYMQLSALALEGATNLLSSDELECVECWQATVNEYVTDEQRAQIDQVRKKIETSIHQKLYEGYDERLNHVVGTLEQAFTAAYQQELRGRYEEYVSVEGLDAVPDQWGTSLEATLHRTELSFPASALASVAGIVAVKKVAAALIVKLGAKTAAKLAVKGTSAAAAAAAGAIVAARQSR